MIGTSENSRERIFAFMVKIPSVGMDCAEEEKGTPTASTIMNDVPPLILPPDEGERLEALRRYGALGLLHAAIFNDIVGLAAFICQTPISLITLVDSHRQWFLSRTGIEACETSRDASFCAHALVGPDMLIVEDAREDARFSRNVLVTGEPFIRFYAGAPLLTPDGYALGTLCVVDRTPRKLTREQKDALRSLSRLVMTQLEMGRLKRDMITLKQSFAPRPAPR